MEQKLNTTILNKIPISTATRRNWDKLNPEIEGKLTARANKRLSKKSFLPLEYFSNENNVDFVKKIVDLVAMHGWSHVDVLYTIALNLLLHMKILNKPHVKKIIDEYNYNTIFELSQIELPSDEIDLLGILYQSLLSEGEKNTKGSYYTPQTITKNMTKDFDFTSGQTFFDPCCGSGAFFLFLKNASPEQIFGMDNDPVAVMLAKFNLLLKYPDIEFLPQIYCDSFIQGNTLFNCESNIFQKKFSYIATNPPWGAKTHKDKLFEMSTSKESFSHFFVKSYRQLDDLGIIRFLFPKSILNVKCHKDIRLFLLEHGSLNRITIYEGSFTGVTTSYIDIEVILKRKNGYVTLIKNNSSQRIALKTFYETENVSFNFIDNYDIEILRKIKKSERYRLDKSMWALGIVTGDNKNKLKSSYQECYEQIFTGKEILPYILKNPTKYVLYDRKQLQQVAKDEYYRAPEKLVYKFISDKLVFAYDNTKSLFLNSANILIPQIPNMSVKTVMAFLNSELFQYIYKKMFAEIKILKGNLMQLPFPEISYEKDNIISDFVDTILNGNVENIQLLQDEIYDTFNLTKEDIVHIKEEINGTVN